ncbi:MAG: hypothetical protein U5M50_00465 [Sphingobium sp.]|nr:hypothetical protein [Sphingobium sp.]
MAAMKTSCIPLQALTLDPGKSVFSIRLTVWVISIYLQSQRPYWAFGPRNLVFTDTDGDGMFEPGAGEYAIDDVEVQLWNTNGTPADFSDDTQVGASQDTANGGCYLFSGRRWRCS